MVEYQQKDRYAIGDLVDIVRLLRSEGGCPWDREQTHLSIKSDLIEETCEVIEAIDLDDKALLREELGDVLLQVVFHSRIEEEENTFNFDDVCDEVCKKLIVRHPHVFGEVKADTTDQVLKNWDAIKMQTKGQKCSKIPPGSHESTEDWQTRDAARYGLPLCRGRCRLHKR